jgi:cytochrome oxidase Cu insertion factor (SCO1/SenC/PrrC family)
MLRKHPTGPPPRPRAARENAAARHYFSDVVLVNQEGERLRLYSDLMRGKVVVVQSIFCSCRGICPVMVANFAKIQEKFRARMGKDLHLLSITVDPGEDTPPRLKEYADRVGAGPGWHFLTGPGEDVNRALQKFGLRVEARENHSNLVMIGNDSTNLWKKAKGFGEAEGLIDVVASVLDDPGPAAKDDGDGPSR